MFTKSYGVKRETVLSTIYNILTHQNDHINRPVRTVKFRHLQHTVVYFILSIFYYFLFRVLLLL